MRIVLSRLPNENYAVYDTRTWVTEELPREQLTEDIEGVTADEIVCYESHTEYLKHVQMINDLIGYTDIRYTQAGTPDGSQYAMTFMSNRAMKDALREDGVFHAADYLRYVESPFVPPASISKARVIDCRGAMNFEFVGFGTIEDMSVGYENLEELYLPEMQFSVFVKCFQNSPLKVVHAGKLYHGDNSHAVTVLNMRGFYHCEQLERADFTGYNIRSIGANCFEGCKRLTEILLPDTVSGIPYAAFSGCKALHSIRLPASLSSIEKFAFSETGLESIVLPEKVELLGTASFLQCKHLQFADFSGLKSFNSEMVLKGCMALREVKLGDGLQSLGTDVFNGSGLKEVQIPTGMPPTGITLRPMANVSPVLLFTRRQAKFLDLEKHSKEFSLKYRVTG